VVPSPFSHAPPGPPPAVHGPKRAVICAVSYKNTKNELKGCINDAMCMKYLLVNRFNFPGSSIIMLTGKNFQTFISVLVFLERFLIVWFIPSLIRIYNVLVTD
jgi:hypothetical protein